MGGWPGHRSRNNHKKRNNRTVVFLDEKLSPEKWDESKSIRDCLVKYENEPSRNAHVPQSLHPTQRNGSVNGRCDEALEQGQCELVFVGVQFACVADVVGSWPSQSDPKRNCELALDRRSVLVEIAIEAHDPQNRQMGRQ